MATPPVFGNPSTEVRHLHRRAAYAIIVDDGRVATIRTEAGLFLPGGGSEPNESAEETVRREVREELGWELSSLFPLGEAIQYFETRARAYRMAAAFFAAEFAGIATRVREHDVVWMEPDVSVAGFYHESHAWAVRTRWDQLSP